MIKRLFITLLLASMPLMVFPASASAADLYNGVDCSQTKVSESAVCKDKNPGSNPIAGSDGLLLKITKIIATIAGMAAIILIIIGGLRYVTSGGDPESARKARNTILNALIGLVVIAISAALITFVVNRLWP